jgi:hypothetical protein
MHGSVLRRAGKTISATGEATTAIHCQQLLNKCNWLLTPVRVNFDVVSQVSLKRFPHSHAEGVAVLTPGEICPQI